MTQQTALIVHALMDSPTRWKANESDTSISDGYHTIALDGSKYGMGLSSYMTEPADREVFLSAISGWKREVGWVPKSSPVVVAPPPAPKLTGEEFNKFAYQTFVRRCRVALRAFLVAKEANVFASKLQEAISELDAALTPVEKIEAKFKEKTDGQPEGDA